MNYATYASRTAGVTALFFAFLLLIFAFTGVSQQTFELVNDLPTYNQQLQNANFWLQTLLVLDNIFIVLYVTTAVLIGLALWQKQTTLFVGLFWGGVVFSGLLDFIENHHLATQLASVTAGLPLSASAIQLQMVLSMLKWHIGYFAFFIVAFALQPQTTLERIFQGLLWLQLPLGVLVYTTYSPVLTQFFFLGRYGNFMAGFLLFAWLMHRRSTQPRLAQTPAYSA